MYTLQFELQSIGCSGDWFMTTVLKSVFVKVVDEFDFPLFTITLNMSHSEPVFQCVQTLVA